MCLQDSGASDTLNPAFAAETLVRGSSNAYELRNSGKGLPVGADPWSELYDYRCLLAHALPEMLDPERVWHDTTSDIARLQEAVAQAVQSD